jgi:hypothetical protein
MPTRPFARVLAFVVAVAFVNVGGAAVAAQDSRSSTVSDASSASTTTVAATPRPQPRLVRIPDPVAHRATLTALNTAVARVEEEGCRKILLEFTDRDGRSLQDRLTSLGVDFDQYASLLVLYDGTRFPLCERGAVAFTAPGSRVVHVCVAQLKQSSVSQPELLTALLIHEILHTLGLGEDPPSSSEITRRVLARCGGNEGSR